jgi:hypothetical protein
MTFFDEGKKLTRNKKFNYTLLKKVVYHDSVSERAG